MNIPEMTRQQMADATREFGQHWHDDFLDIVRAILAARDAQYAAMAGQEPVAWISVKEQMPKSGQIVLAFYLNSGGKERRVRAQWIAAKSHESSPDSDIGEYDEEADAYYDPEGWYECIDNWDEYSSVGICGVEVTHWMPLPAAPGVTHPAPTNPAAQERAEQVCMEAYQVVGSLLSDLGQFNTPQAEKILDNLSAAKLVHADVLPWPSFEVTASTSCEHGMPKSMGCDDCTLARLQDRIKELEDAAQPATEQAEAPNWRDHVEQRIRTWGPRTMNKSGDCLAIADFMEQDSIDDLVDFVCDEWVTLPPASAAGERETSTPQAFQTLKAAIQADEMYAWSWHCVAWSCAFDEGLETGAANRAAARFMSMAFDTDTSKHPHFKPEHQRSALSATLPPASAAADHEPCQGLNCGKTRHDQQHSSACLAETAISQGWPDSLSIIVEAVEEAVGMGHNAWDTIAPEAIVQAVLSLATKPQAEQEAAAKKGGV